jgi:hypothetical protein
MNNIEEYQNLVELLKQALRFYADKSTYGQYMGTPSSIAMDEYGSQARFALEQAEKLEKINQKIHEDYNKFVEDNEEHENHSFDIRNIKAEIDLLNKIGNDGHD